MTEDAQTGAATDERSRYHILQASSNKILGPVSAETVEEWIKSRQIAPQDSIAVVGESQWTPLLQSRFSEAVAQRVQVDSILASVCPRCGSPMAAVAKEGLTVGVWLIILGIALTPVICGIPILIMGIIAKNSERQRTYFTCPRCKYVQS